ncbi:MAG: SMC-Scp complex subunit ScpB, partial [Planctomycetota bacterium]|nr:SMC-Scp complex subunit ScpB [Planctomycetota bacterium]
EYRPDVKPLARPALARRYIDTLALIALNQPVPQSRLVRERGSKIYDHVRELCDQGLVHRTKKGLSYELRTTPRFASEFGLSNNPRDLKAMLARKMTEEEEATLEEYEAHQRFLNPKPEEEENDSFAEATEEAARSLIADNEITVQEEAVISLPATQNTASQFQNDDLAPLPEALEAEGSPVSASSQSTRLSQNPSSHSEALSYEQALGTTGSGRLKRVSFVDPGAEAEEAPQLTRWEKLFLKNSKS